MFAPAAIDSNTVRHCRVVPAEAATRLGIKLVFPLHGELWGNNLRM